MIVTSRINRVNSNFTIVLEINKIKELKEILIPLMYDSDYIYAFNKVVMPIAYEFLLDIVIVSAGFDAAAGIYYFCLCLFIYLRVSS